MPLLNCLLRPELTAQFSICLAKYRLLPLFSHSYLEYPELNCDVMDMHFRNPLGLAAGFDKSETFCIFDCSDTFLRKPYSQSVIDLPFL